MNSDTGPDGDFLIGEPCVLRGMVTERIVVTAGGELTLIGMCLRDLVVERDGRADVRGSVVGSVINRGGHVRVDGTVYGSVVEEAGQTQISTRATIGGRRPQTE